MVQIPIISGIYTDGAADFRTSMPGMIYICGALGYVKSLFGGLTMDPSIALAREQLTYDSNEGILFWKARPEDVFQTRRAFSTWNARYAGLPAGTHSKDGYLRICFKGKRFVLAHRVAWALFYGEWPKHDIDHINGVRSDNRICNLRSVTRTENLRNRKIGKANKSGCMGVSWIVSAGKWRARIGDNGKDMPLGCFSDKDEAIAARRKAEIRLGYHPNHGRT
jgi:hypothetical protein